MCRIRNVVFYTSFIQITATLGLFVSLIVILVTQQALGKEKFADWGWRIPFLVSIVLVSVSLYVRSKMSESPIFKQMKSAGMTSTKPLTDAFGNWVNLKRVLISLFGATAGQGVIWYTGQFYALFYLQTILKVNTKTANIIVAIALVLGMPFFTVFGALSDRIGRKKLMMTACFLAIFAYIPIYHGMQKAAGTNVLSLSSARDKATGAIKLTPMTVDPVTNVPVPAKEAVAPNAVALVGLVWLQVMLVCMIYGPIAAYLVEAFSGQGSVYVFIAAVSHWQRGVWWVAAADWAFGGCGYGEYLCGAVLPDDCGGGDVCGGVSGVEGDA